MKKVLALTLSLVLALCLLAACGGDSKAETPARGVWDGTTYTNESVGITFSAPSDWMIFSDEEVAGLMGTVADNMTVGGETFSAEMLEQSSIYDTIVANTTTGSNVIIAFENLTANHPLGKIVSPSAYLEATEKNIEENFPGVYAFGDITTKTLGGQEYSMVEADGSSSGLIQYYLVRKQGDFMVVNTITVMGTDSVDDIFAMYS